MKHVILCILLCLFNRAALAQQRNGLNSLAERLERFGREIPQEKVFVHMDNTCYFLGDTIWFSAYTRQTNTDEPSKVSNVLYAELLNEDGYLVERKLIELKEGHGNGYFALSRPLMYSGFYELRAYTRWQLNWGCFEHQHSHISKDWFLNNEMEHNFFRDYEKLYSRVFPIYDEPQVKGEFFQEMTVRPLRRYFRKNMDERELMLTLFPEGGNLVAGVENRVAFEAAWSDGEWAEGWLHFGNDSVAAMNRGRGMFTLIPEKGMEREVTFTAKDGQKVTAKLPKPIEVCRLSRGKRCRMGWGGDFSKATDFGYCASQGSHFFGYKLHALCGLSGVIHSYDLSKASVHDINYIKDIKPLYHDCSIFGDKGYIGAEVQLDLFETANIRLECPYRLNQKDWKPTFMPFAKARKRVETLFSQLTDQFLVIRNYAKETCGLFARIIGKISALTALQYINYINNRPIGRIKYALV